MSAAKHHNHRLQSAALLSPHPTATHSSWIISYLSWRRSEEDLERNPKTKKRGKKRWMKMKEKSRTPPHIISRHFLPMISQGNQVVVGRPENTYCILLAMFLPALHDMQYCMSRGKEKKHIIMSSMAELKTSRGLYKCPPANLFHLVPLITYNSLSEDDYTAAEQARLPLRGKQAS